MRTTFLCFLAVATLTSLLHAQSPIPVIVPSVTTAVAKAPAAADTAPSFQGALKSLQALRAANEEIMKQQAATLIKLDEMEKVAQETRIYSKRG